MEGCAIVGESIFVLTWREHVVFEISLDDFKLIKTHAYPRDGWGLTYDASRNVLWASDGSSSLFVLDPSSMKTVRSCKVTLSHNGQTEEPVRYINELEYLNDMIFANVYMDTAGERDAPNYVLAINPVSCAVDQVIPIFGLKTPGSRSAVFNGIAEGFNPGEVLVTGKLWKKVYAIKLDGVESHENPLWSKYNITNYLKSSLEFR
jgi:glutamine cyclotransferase